MSDWLPGCCHPTGGPHGKGEPRTCCHIHVEDLPSNRRAQQGEPKQPPVGWTAQEQHLEDEMTTQISLAEEEDDTVYVQRHQHRL